MELDLSMPVWKYKISATILKIILPRTNGSDSNRGNSSCM